MSQLHRGSLVDGVDWVQLVADLAQAGMTQRQIAERCSVDQSTVSDLARGQTKRPSFEFGSALQKLHRVKCSRRRRAAARA